MNHKNEMLDGGIGSSEADIKRWENQVRKTSVSALTNTEKETFDKYGDIKIRFSKTC